MKKLFILSLLCAFGISSLDVVAMKRKRHDESSKENSGGNDNKNTDQPPQKKQKINNPEKNAPKNSTSGWFSWMPEVISSFFTRGSNVTPEPTQHDEYGNDNINEEITKTTINPTNFNTTNTINKPQLLENPIIDLINNDESSNDVIDFPYNSGIKNYNGDDCFLISSMQTISQIKLFINALESIPKPNRTQVQRNFLDFTYSLRGQGPRKYNLKHNGSALLRQEFAELSENEGFAHGQQDAQEFLSAYLDLLIKNNEELQNIFKLGTHSSMECSICTKKSNHPSDPIFILNLEIARNKTQQELEDPKKDNTKPMISFGTLQDCLGNYCAQEIISDYQCQECSLIGNTSRQIKFQQLPPILIISLKRFGFFDEKKFKARNYITFPLELDTAPYTINPDIECRYQLFGVIVHVGQTLRSGHYWAYAKDRIMGTWLYYNDNNKPEIIDEKKLIETIQSDQKINQSRTPYILLYERVNN